MWESRSVLCGGFSKQLVEIIKKKRPNLSISTAAAFSTASRARRLVWFAVEETDIRNGKDSSKVRSRFQTPTRRTNRSGGVEHGAGRARLSTGAQRAGTLARSVSKQHVDRSSIGSGTTARSREPEAEEGRGSAAISNFKPFTRTSRDMFDRR